MYLHAVSGFAGEWSSSHLQIACLNQKCLIISYMSFRSILPCERAGLAESPATRSALLIHANLLVLLGAIVCIRRTLDEQTMEHRVYGVKMSNEVRRVLANLRDY